jgi:carboxyl-terminal processing protease
LNLKQFKKEMALSDAKIKKFKAISDYNNKLKFNSLPNEIALFEKDSLLKQKRERWHEDLQKDLYIEETLNIIAEIRASQNGKGLPKKLSIN